MKPIGDKRVQTAANAWGQDTTCHIQEYIVEDTDVGATRHNYLGYQSRTVLIKREDVGRHIIVYSDPTGWTCWIWALS